VRLSRRPLRSRYVGSDVGESNKGGNSDSLITIGDDGGLGSAGGGVGAFFSSGSEALIGNFIGGSSFAFFAFSSCNLRA